MCNPKYRLGPENPLKKSFSGDLIMSAGSGAHWQIKQQGKVVHYLQDAEYIPLLFHF